MGIVNSEIISSVLQKSGETHVKCSHTDSYGGEYFTNLNVSQGFDVIEAVEVRGITLETVLSRVEGKSVLNRIENGKSDIQLKHTTWEEIKDLAVERSTFLQLESARLDVKVVNIHDIVQI